MTAILNQNKGYNVSNKYKVIQTQDLINHFTAKGFEVSQLIETIPKNKDRVGFQKHMIRLCHPDLKFNGVGDSKPEIVIVNSYDGSTSLRFYVGVYRLICSNGMVVGNNTHEYRIRHVGNIIENADNAMGEIIEYFPKVASSIQRMQETKLNSQVVRELCIESSLCVAPKNNLAVYPDTMGKVRRYADNGLDLWRVFNRIQETAIRGGLRYDAELPVYGPNKTQVGHRIVTRHTKAIKSIERQVKVNRDLWNIAEKYIA